jgi:hypothetical protein
LGWQQGAGVIPVREGSLDKDANGLVAPIILLGLPIGLAMMV